MKNLLSVVLSALVVMVFVCSVSAGTVHVAAGSYTVSDRLEIPAGKSITIDGTIGANKNATDSSVVTFTATPSAGLYDFQVYGSSSTIQNLILDFGDRESQFTGITVGELGDGPAVIQSVTISNNILMGDGVVIQTGSGRDISSLAITNNTIMLDNNNNSTDGGEGIYINPYTNGTTDGINISNNTITGRIDYGIAVEASDVTVSGNSIDNTVGTANRHGLRYLDWADNTLSGAIISSNTVAHMVAGLDVRSHSGSGTLAGSASANTFINNTTGISIGTGGGSVTATGNNIYSNTIGLSNETASAITATGNWWGSYAGPGATDAGARVGDTIVNSGGGSVNSSGYVLGQFYLDSDSNGTNNNLDADDDGDGYTDVVEIALFTSSSGVSANELSNALPVAPTDAFVDDDWSSNSVGDTVVGSDTNNHVIGYDAFPAIQDAINAVQ